MDKIIALAAPAGRVLLSLIFLVAGAGKLAAPAATIGYIASHGMPAPQVAYGLSLVVEIGGGLLILVGYQTRLAAFILAGFCVVTALIFHNDFADRAQSINFMKNLAMAGGFLQLLAYGAGGISLDNRSRA